ncbi:MAG: hypothetical protein IMF26_06655 [Candidatus Fermentithermobacillus carboniphilus]|uniref:ATP-binding protein n=1 Tax=Candidatus Fermentithermobacillus carboniphilus TaxID=3085328 RepID=A0AAT9LAY8_9FIRM|nr:MAG: hypothetical protein IMF26_06655 [Candidatus Fermentithermobacillus carboniphilus]
MVSEWTYSDCLTVREDFIPVFTEDIDKQNRGNWKFFIPHDQTRTLLEKLIAALERAKPSDCRSIWLTGAYGTGKTFTCFVIKHLLEDPLEEVQDYFIKHSVLSHLWPRFRALRQRGNYLTVYRSGSGHIKSSRRLYLEVEQAIKQELQSHGYADAVTENIMEELVSKLTAKDSIFNWDHAFRKHRGMFQDVSTSEGVINKLRDGDLETGEKVAAVLEQEGVIIKDSPEAIREWIRAVITRNNLKGILFIWDEFTQFFANSTDVDSLQELAHATTGIPFYLFLVTHRALDQFTRIDEGTRKKLHDRFHLCPLEMKPVTAYKLISNVIEPKPAWRKDWEAKRDTLWSNVDAAVLHINLLGERVAKEELKALAPIHPLTAYLLATISSNFSSSQRTLFQFLKASESGSFREFIANYPKNNWYWLTPDYLWEYFFENVKVESVDSVADILTHYSSSRQKLHSEGEVRVFRVMLLLTALWRQTHGAHPLLKPSLEVLKRMFMGTELAPRVAEIAERICDQGLMLAVPSGTDQEYIIPSGTIDHKKLQQYKQQAQSSLTFENMIDDRRFDAEFVHELKQLLSLQGAAKLRHPVQIISAKELKLKREKIIRGTEYSYEIGVVVVVAQEDEHLHGTEDIALELSKHYLDCCILISQCAFGAKRWHDWLDHRAYQWYYEEMHDSAKERYYSTKAKKLVDEWLTSVRLGRIKAFFHGGLQELSGCESVPGYLEDVVSQVYPYGPERLSKIATLYTSSWGKGGAEIGLRIARTIQRPYKDVVEELERKGLWEDGALTNAKHPLGEMKRVVDEFFKSQDHVNLHDLWKALQEPPYGLMPSPIGILLFSLLMRDYSQGYYYSDGVNSLPLNPNKLAELIQDVMKGNKSDSSCYTVRRMSTEAEEFCKMAQEVFHLRPEEAAYPEEARKNMRKSLANAGFPVWCVKYSVEEIRDPRVQKGLAPAVEALTNVLSYDLDELDDREMKRVFEAVQPVKSELSRLLTRERMQQGMLSFLRTHTPQLSFLAGSLGLDVPRIMSRLRALLQEDVYLWREERVKDKLPEITAELNLTLALDELCGAQKDSLDDVRLHFQETWFRSKLPLTCYKVGQPAEVAAAIDYLYQVVYQPSRELKVDSSEEIRRLSGTLRVLLRDGVRITQLLVAKYTGQSLEDSEAAQLYEMLPSNLSAAPEDEVKRAILCALEQLTKQKKIAELKKLWQSITSTDSPVAWSEAERVPIQLILEGQQYHEFFTRYSRLQSLPEREIEEMLQFLTEHAEELKVLHDKRYVLNKFIDVAAGEYAELVRQSDAQEGVLNYVYDSMGGNVQQWPIRLNEVAQAIRKWVTQNYQATVYPRVLKALEGMSAEDIKRFVEELVSKDALVGARLLAVLEIAKKRG